jgi:hypothetical protein
MNYSCIAYGYALNPGDDDVLYDHLKTTMTEAEIRTAFVPDPDPYSVDNFEYEYDPEYPLDDFSTDEIYRYFLEKEYPLLFVDLTYNYRFAESSGQTFAVYITDHMNDVDGGSLDLSFPAGEGLEQLIAFGKRFLPGKQVELIGWIPV